MGDSSASGASSSVTPQAPTATTFTLTGPSSGNIYAASSNFIVTPNDRYTGTITITPSGSGSTGLSATTLTFSDSSTAQTFTITPQAAGSITLTPTNNGSLSNPSALTYTSNAIAPNAPTNVSATAGNAQATVSFTAPTNDGGSSITGYTVTSNPGSLTATGSASPITVTGLTNGTSYTFTVKATNAVGDSSASGASSSVTPTPMATTISAVQVSGVTDTSATISWTTDQHASTKVLYGIDPTYENQTLESNTSPRALSHSVVLVGLKSCTAYLFRPISTTADSLTTNGSLYRFTTTGCTSTAPVVAQISTNTTLGSPSSVSLLSATDNVSVSIAIPANYSSNESIFQVKQLASATFDSGVSAPQGLARVGSSIFNLEAVSKVNGEKVTTFDAPITVTMTYTDAEIHNVQESTLHILRWNGSSWGDLQNCSVSASSNRVSCETSHFSDFALFGEAVAQVAEESDDDSCGEDKPNTPKITGIEVMGPTVVRVYFSADRDHVRSFGIKYGTTSNFYTKRDVSIPKKSEFHDVNLLTPGSTYYFRIRSGNQCRKSDWSQEVSATLPQKYKHLAQGDTVDKTAEPETTKKNAQATSSSSEETQSEKNAAKEKTEKVSPKKSSVVRDAPIDLGSGTAQAPNGSAEVSVASSDSIAWWKWLLGGAVLLGLGGLLFWGFGKKSFSFSRKLG